MGRLGVTLAAFALAAPPLAAQRAVEWQAHVVGVVTGVEFVGAGMGLGVRTPGRLRIAGTLSGGDWDGAAAVRGEAALSYHVNPFRRRGVAPYVGGGIAITATSDRSAEYVLLVLGLESRPGGGAGWFIEAGAAGGLRVTGGLRLRRRGPR